MSHFLAVFVLGFVCHASLGQEWTRFRGPNGSGIGEAPGVPSEFTEKDYNWKIKLPGGGHSSPVLWGDRIFVTCSDRESGTRFVLCVKASDGEVIWAREFKSHPYSQLHRDNNYASSTPAVDEKNVYISSSTPEEYALTALDHDGKDVWRRGLGRYISQHGSGTSPVVVGDVVLIGNDQEGPRSSLFGIDRNNGSVLWEKERAGGKVAGMSAATPVMMKNTDGTEQAVFCSRYEGICGLDPRTGATKWQIKDPFKTRTVGSPVVMNDLVIGFSGEGVRGHEFVAVRPDGTSVTITYNLTQATPYVPTPLYKDGLLFVLNDTGTVTCYKAATGKVAWQQKIGKEYYSSPVCAGGRVFCISKEGEVACFAASDKFEVLGRSALGELCHTTPAIASGRMYLRTYTHLISLGGK